MDSTDSNCSQYTKDLDFLYFAKFNGVRLYFSGRRQREHTGPGFLSDNGFSHHQVSTKFPLPIMSFAARSRSIPAAHNAMKLILILCALFI